MASLQATEPCLVTERLLLRRWRPADLGPFADLNADPAVMATLPRLLDRQESDALAARAEESFERRGFGLWAVEVPGSAPFVGFVGLSVPGFDPPFPHRGDPVVEVGWRLARPHWGHGYATEGASAAIAFAFEALDLPEVVSFTSVGNARSRAVMERLGMQHDPAGDFDHPSLAAHHPLSRHVLYRSLPEGRAS